MKDDVKYLIDSGHDPCAGACKTLEDARALAARYGLKECVIWRRAAAEPAYSVRKYTVADVLRSGQWLSEQMRLSQEFVTKQLEAKSCLLS